MIRNFHTSYKLHNTKYKSSRSARKAFTLAELLIVIGIIAALSVVSVGFYANQQKAKILENTAQEIANYLRFAQQKSVSQEQGLQWGIHFDNPTSGSDFYALYTGATYTTPIETRYLPAGIEFQTPVPSSSTNVSYEKMTGFLSGGSYQQIILKASTGSTKNIVVCQQGIITYNTDIGICAGPDTSPPTVSNVTASNTSYSSYVDSPFDLSADVNDPQGGVTSCEYTINGGTNWYSATVGGYGPSYTCTKTGITASDGTSLTLNMRATSSGGTGTGTAINRTVDAIAPTASDNWTDNWTATSPVTVTITPSDGSGSGISTTKYCVDTNDSCYPSTSYSSPVSVTCASGSTCTQYVRYAAWDNVNNVSSIYSKRVRQDKQAPTDGTLTATPGNQQVPLSWTAASDSGSGLATSSTYKLVFSTSSSPAINCTSGTQIYTGTSTSYLHTNLTNDITHYYRVCAYDAVSNVSNGATASTIPFNPDVTPPSIGTITPSDYTYTSYVSSPFTLSATATDSESNVTSCEYTINGGTNWYSADVSGTKPDFICSKTGITASNGASLTLNMRATSSGGTNTGTAINRTVDSANPTASDNWTDNWTVTSPITVTITPSDGSGSGVSVTKYCVDSVDTCTPSTTGTSTPVTCASGSTCTQYVRYAAWDNVNNASSIYSKRVRQDKETPTASDNWTDNWTGTSPVTVTITPSDGSGSGIASTYYCVDNTDTCTPSTTGTSTPVTCASTCTQYVRYYTKDNVNNASSIYSKRVRQDLQAPSIGTINPSNYVYASYVSSPFTLSATATDSGSPVTSCEYTINGGTNWYSADVSGTGPDYTCSKTGITSANGSSLTLNIRATSSGGTGTGTSISRTVDSANPTASDNWTDNWTATSPVNVTITPSDGSGSGIATTKYCVYTADTCDPSTGTTGTSASVTCSSGSVCTQYVRYAAWDNVNNASSIYSKTVRQDRQAPTDGTLTPTPGNQQVSLSWTAASDGSGSGLATSDTYKVVFSTSSSPAINCTSGTQIYTGTSTSYLHTGLTNGTTHYYRVCAYDAVSNVSNGATATAIPDNYCDNDSDSHYSTTRSSSCTGSSRITQGDDCDDTCATCYPGSTAYTTSADGKDQNCINGVDEADTGYCTACTPNLGTLVIFGYDASCVLSSSGTYIYATATFTPPSNTASCSCSVKTCTYNSSTYANCAVNTGTTRSNTKKTCTINYYTAGSTSATVYYNKCQPVTGCTVSSTETHYY
jgi:type II secretory pathway pseudopilin PulG